MHFNLMSQFIWNGIGKLLRYLVTFDVFHSRGSYTDMNDPQKKEGEYSILF